MQGPGQGTLTGQQPYSQQHSPVLFIISSTHTLSFLLKTSRNIWVPVDALGLQRQCARLYFLILGA